MKPLRIALLATSALVPVWVPSTLANPLGPQVTVGDVTIDGLGSAGVTVNQDTNKAIIEWRTFNISPDESTSFVQPTNDAVILNRVTGGEGASQILGAGQRSGLPGEPGRDPLRQGCRGRCRSPGGDDPRLV